MWEKPLALSRGLMLWPVLNKSFILAFYLLKNTQSDMRHGGFVTLFLIIAAISILLDLYVSSGLKTLMRDWPSQKLRSVVLWAYWVISLTVTILLIASFSSFTTARGMMPFH